MRRLIEASLGPLASHLRTATGSLPIAMNPDSPPAGSPAVAACGVPLQTAGRLRVASQGAAGVAVIAGALALVGWAIQLHILASGWPGLVTMKANTAVTFIVAGIALWLLHRSPVTGKRLALGRACAAFVGAIGLLTLSEHLLGWDAGIDQLLFRDPAPSATPGRMSPITAVSFSLFAAALALLDWQTKRGRSPPAWLLLAAGFLSFIALAGYLSGASHLYQVPGFISIALHTAATFLVLALGGLCARPDRGVLALFFSDTWAGTICSTRLALRRLLRKETASDAPLLLTAVRDAIQVLEQTKRSFKSLVLGQLRERLEAVLRTQARSD